MSDTRSSFGRFLIALATPALVAVAACSAAPGGESTAESSSEALRAPTFTCPALQTPENCGWSGGGVDYGEGPGGSNIIEKPSYSCDCVDVTAQPTGPQGSLTCNGDAVAVPSQLAALGCTLGTSFRWGFYLSATVWACPIGDGGALPSAPMFGNPVCDGTGFPCEVVTAGPLITNPCVGNADSGWTLIEDEVIRAEPDGSGGGGCKGGCPRL